MTTNFLRLLLLLAPVVAPVFAQYDIGAVEVPSNIKTVPVRVSADSQELNSLALTAFGSHGRYRLVASGYQYDIRFSVAAPSQVRVDIARGDGQPVAAEIVPGTNTRNALLRAADVAVEKTNGLGLRGYFASQLTFIGEGTGHKEVYVGDLFFSNGAVRRITGDRVIAMFPRWAPDGREVIYTSWLHGAPDIFLMNLGTNQRTTFASYRGSNFSARFSPNGRQVAMALTDQRSGSTEIYVADAQGRSPSPRTHSDAVVSSPCWSPDGSRLVFTQWPGPQLYVMPAGGGFPHRITSGSISKYCAEPDWSRANPNKIAFTIGVGGRYQIAVYDFAKGESTQVSKAPFDGIEASWLPDGRHVVYTARDRSTSRLCILDTETGKSTPISPRGFGPTEQANVWSP
jgi:TolB protein